MTDSTIASDLTEDSSWDLDRLQRHTQIETMEDIEMRIFDVFTDPESTVPSLVQGTARLLPALLGLNEQPDNEEAVNSSYSDLSYFQAKISLMEEKQGLKDDSSERTPTTASASTGKHRQLPSLPMVSDNTVDRLRLAFLTEDIPHPVSSSDPNRKNVMGKIEIFRYDVLGHTSFSNRPGEHRRQSQVNPTSQQVNKLRRIASRLGKVIENRRRQNDLKNEVYNLREDNRRLVESQNLAKVGQWELDLTATDPANSLYWSDGIYDLFRINKDEFGASYEAFLDSIHPDDRQFVDESYTNSLKTKLPYDIVHRLLFQETDSYGNTYNEIRWVREICRTEYDEETGKPLYSVGIVQDITDERRAKAQADRMRELVVQNPVRTRGRASTSPNWKIKYLSNASSRSTCVDFLTGSNTKESM